MKYGTLALLTGLMLISVLIPSGSQAAAEERSFVIIINTDNPAESITKEKASRLFMKKVSKWSEEDFTEKVVPVDQSPSSKLREDFSKDVHGRSLSGIRNYWQRQIFSGRAVPPAELDSDEAVMEFVRANRGAIGYVSQKADLKGVKELTLADD